jgi:hypothetical protein
MGCRFREHFVKATFSATPTSSTKKRRIVVSPYRWLLLDYSLGAG